METLSKVSMEVVIMGAGMGGLFCGALLAKRGVRVTVLEKNASIGGGLQTFTRNGETYETGMHVAGGFNEGGILNSICRYLGIRDRLRIRESDLMLSVTYTDSGRTYDLPAGREAFIRYLSGLFPRGWLLITLPSACRPLKPAAGRGPI